MGNQPKVTRSMCAAATGVTALIIGAFAGSVVLAISVWSGAEAVAQEGGPTQFPILFQDDFERGSAEAWQPGDPAAWKVMTQGENHAYALFQQSKYRPKVRSPVNISLVKDLAVGEFVLEAKVQSTTRDYGHRDLCLFFGYQDPTHFYYVHFGKQADPHANSVFLVNGAPRVSIAKSRTDGTHWTDGWHRVKLVRRTTGKGEIEVYFDNMSKPAMTAEDKTFTWGQVGLGSFDDTGNFDDVRLRGRRVIRDDRRTVPATRSKERP